MFKKRRTRLTIAQIEIAHIVVLKKNLPLSGMSKGLGQCFDQNFNGLHDFVGNSIFPICRIVFVQVSTMRSHAKNLPF